MKSEITISELAKLMNVSVHQIRYFEEKGVLQPAYNDHNQYRMYSMDQIYQLSHVLLLRKLGVPVHTIKEGMTSYSADQYVQLFQQSLCEVDEELRRLQDLKQYLVKVLQEQQHFSSQAQAYQVKRRNITYLEQWIELDANAILSAKALVEQAKPIPNVYETDIHYIYDGSSKVRLFLETAEPSEIYLPEGHYLCKTCDVHHEEELEDHIHPFNNEATARGYVLIGPITFIERSYLSLFSNNELMYELQAQIDPDCLFGKE